MFKSLTADAHLECVLFLDGDSPFRLLVIARSKIQIQQHQITLGQTTTSFEFLCLPANSDESRSQFSSLGLGFQFILAPRNIYL